jgi:hypothetical protein
MAVRQIIGVVGAVIGYVVGGPQGAMYGWQIGSAFGNAWDPQVLRGPSIGDLGQQTAQEGGPRPIVFGLSPPMAGNVIATSEPKIVKKKKSQGKGGPKVQTESVYRTYAIGVCEGPIKRFVRVWRNGLLVWSDQDQEDMNYGPKSEDELLKWLFRQRGNGLKFEERVDFFLGTYDQEPSPFLEEIYGAGTTPAFRGTAYMMIQDDDVTDFRGAIPQYLFQVERCEGEYLTSRPYSIEDVEEMHIDATDLHQATVPYWDEDMHIGAEVSSGTLRVLSLFYTDWPPEEMHIGAEMLTPGTLRALLLSYPDWPVEEMHIGAALTSGTLEVKLVTYQNWPFEEMHIGGALQSGTLT